VLRSGLVVDPAAARVGRVLLAVALLVATLLGGRSLSDEDAVSLQGDMPRHMMNGVFLLDFFSSPAWTFDGALTFAQHYFAQYPALSIGHHPPLLPLSLVPFYAVVGVSVLASRLAILSFFLTSVWLMYTLGRRQYDARVAGWAALLFATHPFITIYGQVVLSEMLAVMLVLATLNLLLRFRDAGRLGDYLWFVGFAFLSLAAKQLAAFLFPAYGVLLLIDGGWSRLRKKSVMTWTVVGAALTVLLVVATVVMSPYNVRVVINVLSQSMGLASWRAIANPILHQHLMPILGALALTSLVVAVVNRDKRIRLSVCWIVSVWLGVLFVTGPHDVERYAIYAIPAYCLCGAALLASTQGRRRLLVISAALVVAGATQLTRASSVHPAGASGYEGAAELVLTDRTAPTVLYSASVDTGYFVFFVRKNDPERRLVVLRSDKLLTTSLMANLSEEDLIQSREEIYTLLDRYGTRFVVIEDRPSGSVVLEWLRDEVKSDRFIERQRTPIETNDRRLRDVDLVVYEYKAAKPADPDAALGLDLPLVGRRITVRLSDLQPGNRR
jgi:hypothetical protein